MSFATLDLDRFKDVNDQYGHGAGDEVLKAFADILRQSIRASDLAGRLGGEEFAIALPGTSVEVALIVLERIRTKTEQAELQYLGKTLRFTVSIGVSDAHGKQLEDIDYLIKSSDAQLYEAKRRGRNRIQRDSPEDLFSGFDGTQESTPAQ
jgi:diguanylate cyclase (GGDEF)-like protein